MNISLPITVTRDPAPATTAPRHKPVVQTTYERLDDQEAANGACALAHHAFCTAAPVIRATLLRGQPEGEDAEPLASTTLCLRHATSALDHRILTALVPDLLAPLAGAGVAPWLREGA